MTKLATLTLTGLVIALISLTEPGWAAAPGQKVLYAFQGGNDGAGPTSSLIFDASGNLYGTTAGGGTADAGTVFELTPVSNGWSEAVLYSFQGGIDGNYANSSLVMDGAGNLYGTTLQGGAGSCTSGCGTVFELTPPTNGGPWTESILYSFQGGADGANPNSGVILDKFGNLYGTTVGGGDLTACEGTGCGTVFEISIESGNWTDTTLYSFKGGTQDGALPKSGLTLDGNGNLYGATVSAGAGGLGTIYELSLSNGNWSEKILYAFPHGGGGGLQGRLPSSTLVFDGKGDLYGTAEGGNANGCCGVVFVLVPHSGGNWTESIFRFTSKNGGAGTGALVFDSSGNLYGTSPLSGQFKSGTAYRLKQRPGGSVTDTSYSFCSQTGCPDGSAPYGGLILDGSGNLYGTTFEGALGYGVVYEITP